MYLPLDLAGCFALFIEHPQIFGETFFLYTTCLLPLPGISRSYATTLFAFTSSSYTVRYICVLSFLAFALRSFAALRTLRVYVLEEGSIK